MIETANAVTFVETGTEDLTVAQREIAWWSRVAETSDLELSVVFTNRALTQLSVPEVRQRYHDILDRHPGAFRVVVRSEADTVEVANWIGDDGITVMSVDDLAVQLLDGGSRSVWH
ncbi:hypothetical protein NBRGN_110_01640 [Nocardia brasiliensis NBRC 14402]|uniref:hypothetical protein n=1 Tax=Nocardia brasiliensis TaxID=37326 RepID=UPI0002F44AC9|nr:hypothetical protein [Nocardia brasiliensis]ASF09542.1 hypothetical protein CEQ30_21700 [Nocardia brasiliensis]GAJ86499.1 hypothetical protein NBRGN_110_01640 [Nocardia brasiliensis NBRC 14402]SUB55453.1 Uncharacterised protein [Nocardia brasiliensis]